MTGLTSAHVSFERIEFQGAWVEQLTSPSEGWEISILLKNTGSQDSLIENVFVNSMPIPLSETPGEGVITDEVTTNIPKIGLRLGSGETKIIKVWIAKNYASLSSGTTIELTVLGSAGATYNRLLTLS